MEHLQGVEIVYVDDLDDIIADPRCRMMEEEAEIQEQHELVLRMLVCLPKRQREVLAYMYRYYDGQERTVEETADALGISYDAARKAHSRGLENLKRLTGSSPASPEAIHQARLSFLSLLFLPDDEFEALYPDAL